MVVPIQIALYLVVEVKALFHQAVAQAQGHAGVICPLARLQLEGATAHHDGQRLERATRFEFHRGANGVPHGQAQQGPSGTVNAVL